MSEHLLQQTLSPEMAAMAEYYQQGVSPPTPAEAAAARYAEASDGAPLSGAALDTLAAQEVERLAETARDATGNPVARDELAVLALGAFIAVGLVERPEALAALHRSGHNNSLGRRDVGERLDHATEQARTAKDYSSATATPRADMLPALAERLGIDATRALTASEIANLLNGQRAD